MKIEHAVQTDCESCVDFIWEGVLGKRYYPTKEMLSPKVKQGIENDCFFVARNDEGQLLGILWYQLEGAFNTYPYLHMIEVKEDSQKQGLGTKLMDFFEDNVLTSGKNQVTTKVFLVTSNYTPVAERMYVNRGYIKVCEIENLFRRKMTEKLYMKILIKE